MRNTSLLTILILLSCGGDAWGVHYGDPIDANEFRAVGQVAILGLDNQVQSLGTGTLIAPNLMLTADHVVRSAPTPFHIRFKLESLPDVVANGIAVRSHPESINFSGLSENYEYRTTDKMLSDLFDRSISIANDIAIVKLNLSFPDDVEFYPLSTELPGEGELATLVGYGYDESRKSSSGRKQGTLKYLRKWENYLIFGSGSAKHQRSDHGDSGGPVLVKKGDSWKIAAIVRGAGILKATDYVELEHDQFGSYVSIHTHLDWLKSSRKELDQIVRPLTEDGKYFHVRRVSPDYVRVPWTRQQMMTAFELFPDRQKFLQQTLLRGVSDPLSASLVTDLREKAGVPDDAIIVITLNAKTD